MKKRKCFVSFANNEYIKSGHCLRDRFSKGFKFNKIKDGIAFSYGMHEGSVQKIKSKFKNRFMKKIIVGLVSLVNILAVNANSNVPVSEKVQQSFEKEFIKATNLNWEAKDKNVFHATFTYNGSQVEANFDGEGNLLSTVRLITEYQLPVMIVKTLSRDYGQYKIRRAQECNNNNDTHYLVTIYNNTESISLKFFSNGDEQRISRTKNIN